MYVTDFEEAVANEAHRRGHDGVVCGHIHRAEIRTINGVLYCNDGDWVESCTALVESVSGKLELVYWHFQPQTHQREVALVTAVP
jgi:UDP-2,3-diacylglucosamine pyrophosphatase LpxH